MAEGRRGMGETRAASGSQLGGHDSTAYGRRSSRGHWLHQRQISISRTHRIRAHEQVPRVAELRRYQSAAPHPNTARLFTEFFVGPEAQRTFGNIGEYVFHPEVDHKFKKDVKNDQIVVMRLPNNEELETWSNKFREMF